MDALALLLKLIKQRDLSSWVEQHLDDEPPPERCSIHVESRSRWELLYGRANESGFYEPPTGPSGFPHVSIFREIDQPALAFEVAEASTDPLEELIILAHEFGHHESWLAGHRPPLSGKSMLTDERLADPEAAYAEEVRAWHYARQILAGLEPEGPAQFDAWDTFASIELASLFSYQSGLSLREERAELIRCQVGATFK